MQFKIIQNDNIVEIDGDARRVDLSHIPPVVRVIEWDDATGSGGIQYDPIPHKVVTSRADLHVADIETQVTTEMVRQALEGHAAAVTNDDIVSRVDRDKRPLAEAMIRRGETVDPDAINSESLAERRRKREAEEVAAKEAADQDPDHVAAIERARSDEEASVEEVRQRELAEKAALEEMDRRVTNLENQR